MIYDQTAMSLILLKMEHPYLEYTLLLAANMMIFQRERLRFEEYSLESVLFV